MSLIILHFSDIHINNSNDAILGKARKIAQCTLRKLFNAAKLFIVVSGDIAYSVTKEQNVKLFFKFCEQ